MKTRFPSILGVFAAILMVASFVVPMNIAAPSPVSADPGIMKWDTVATPGAVFGKNDIANYHFNANAALGDPLAALNGWGSELQDLAVGNDGMTFYGVGRASLGPLNDALAHPAAGAIMVNALAKSTSSGIASSTAVTTALNNTLGYGYDYAPAAPGTILPVNAYNVAVAPDDAKFVAITSDPANGSNAAPTLNDGPRAIWVSTDGGSNWELAFDGGRVAAATNLAADEWIRDIDISIDWGGKRDIGFVTQRTAGGAGRWFVRSSSGFNNWIEQAKPGVAGTAVQYYAIRFSPTYNADASIGLVYATAVGTVTLADRGTFFNVAIRDLNQNLTNGWTYPAGMGIEVVNPSNIAQGRSPATNNLNNAWLQLPSDFSGQSSSLRRAYISLDAFGGVTGNGVGQKCDGIFRVDDTTVYMLMDTSNMAAKSIYSIAYFGTYASGKLLAGERMGFPCTATVPTWFTDSPTTCPVPCWYPALKPTTGAASQGTCPGGLGIQDGVGAAIVAWNADGSLGYAATGSNAVTLAAGYWLPWINAPHANDESAFAISRNNGETWNQISFIDTTIDWFNDVAVAPDCTTIYLASVNRNAPAFGMWCNSFDSVWRSTINPNVAAPLPAIPPLGFYWERVFTHTTSYSCNQTQTDLPILRVVPFCTDKKDGEIVGWAAQRAGTTGSTTGTGGGGVMAWSPDFGDYWAMIYPRYPVQDFAFESSTTLYVVNTGGLVQRLPYTGTSWSTNLPSTDTTLLGAHTIVAVPDGKVLVGAAANQNYQAAYSADKGVTYSLVLDSLANPGNEHVIFDVDFKNNSFIYMGDDSVAALSSGSVYRNTVPSYTRWQDSDMMSVTNGASYVFANVLFGVPPLPPFNWPAGNTPPHAVGQFGIAQAWTGDPQPALYSAHDNLTAGNSFSTTIFNSAVCRTLKPRDGMPKPGIQWACLDIFAPITTSGVLFTLEPTSLKYCGCCTLDTNTTLYAIDDESGNALRWQGTTVAPALSGRFKRTPGYDPVARRGLLWAYTDCLAKKGPILKGPADKFLIGADPVTGRNQQIDLSWEQLCLSTSYQLQIGKDAAFTLRINPAISNFANITAVTGSLLLNMDATNMTSPAAWIAPGALPEAGAIYYWRIRSARSATGQIADSPWSEARSFTVKAGFIVNTPYYGVQLLAPNNGCIGCKVKPASFSWSPWKEATKYQFDLAKDPEFKTLVVTATTTTTGYEYSGTLDYSTNYFWRVKALEVNGLNIPSDWSATFSMQTEPAPAPPAPPPAEPATPVWVWVIIAIGAILVIVTLVLIFKTRRV